MNKEEWEEIEKILDEDDYFMENYDNLSSGYCSQCGNRLTVDEFEEFEAECSECVYADTAGIITDEVEEELN